MVEMDTTAAKAVVDFRSGSASRNAKVTMNNTVCTSPFNPGAMPLMVMSPHGPIVIQMRE